MSKIYVDSCIFIDYWWDRKDGLRPLGEFAFKLINRAIECEFSVVISEDSVMELSNVLGKNRAFINKNLLSGLRSKNKIELVDAMKRQEKEASELSKKYNVPVLDAQHAILARDNQITLISRDNHFFYLSEQKEFRGLEIKRPEEV